MYIMLLLMGFATTLATGGLALWLGDRPAKIAGAGCIAALFGTYIAQNPRDFYNPQYGVAAVDVALMILFIGLAGAYRRSWLIAAGGFMMLAVATHVAYLIDLRIVSNIRITASYIWAYFTLAAVLWGVWEARRARVIAISRDQ